MFYRVNKFLSSVVRIDGRIIDNILKSMSRHIFTLEKTFELS